jgi:DedD protein
MDQGLKERLVGAAVLVVIGAWLIPWVLDGPEAPLDSGTSSLQLPVAEEPMPMRTQTLRLGEPPPAEAATAPNAPTACAAASATETPAPEATDPAAPGAATQTSGTEAVASVAPQETATEGAADAAPAPAESSPPPSAAAETPQPEPAAAVAAAPPKPAPKPAAPPAPAGDWIVQLGSFGEQANARRVADRAGTYGYKAEVSTVRSDGRTLYRVRVGPATTRARADATASALRAHGIDARAVATR